MLATPFHHFVPIHLERRLRVLFMLPRPVLNSAYHHIPRPVTQAVRPADGENGAHVNAPRSVPRAGEFLEHGAGHAVSMLCPSGHPPVKHPPVRDTRGRT